MAPPQRLALVFGSGQVELDAALAGRRGGLRALEREAEAAWGLPPQSFSIHGAGGKVDTPQALQRALAAADGEVCALEVRERPEWRAVAAAMKAFEGQVLAKVEAALGGIREDLRRTDAKLCGGLAPVVQCLALEQTELREGLQKAEERLCNSIAPMVQCLAMEQMDVRAKVAELEAAAPGTAAAKAPVGQGEAAKQAIQAPQLVMLPVLCASPPGQEGGAAGQAEGEEAGRKGLEELEERLRQELGGRVGATEQADEFLFRELQVLRDVTKTTQADVKELREGVRGLEEKQAAAAPALDQAERSPAAAQHEEQKRSAHSAKYAAGGPDAWLQWGEALPQALPYSGKVAVELPQGAAGGRRSRQASRRGGVEVVTPAEAAALFARGPSLRPLERTSGCQSLPHLPPLR